MIQRTLILIKPDGVERGLIGDIIKRFEQRGLKIVGMKMVKPQREVAERHYKQTIADKHGEEVRSYLLDYITGGPVIAMVIEGSNAIALVRKIVGSTYPGEADIGTIRGDYAHASEEYAKSQNQGHNLVHASENQEDAEEEIKLWFGIEEIYDYKISIQEHIF
jgi:nucleoside-diphosphate kinase